MADFGYLSDTDDSAVEELISQAKELCVLEQVSAINCSSFTDSDLPPDLESRFRRLKSLPASKPSANLSDGKAIRHSNSALSKSEAFNFSPPKQEPTGNPNLKSEKEGKSFSGEEDAIFPDLELNPVREKGLKGKPGHGCAPSPSNSSDSCLEDAVLSPPRKGSKRKPKSRSFSSPFGSSKSWMDSPSPPHSSGCLNLWCTPKKVSKKKSKEAKVINSVLDWEKSDEFLTDLNAFSAKEQLKILKKAVKEQEKVSREAAKIVKLAKQASSRMSFHDIEDELSLSDDDGSAK